MYFKVTRRYKLNSLMFFFLDFLNLIYFIRYTRSKDFILEKVPEGALRKLLEYGICVVKTTKY